MELSKQVVSLELAKKLKDLGVNAPSLFKWTDDPWGKPYVVYAQSKDFSYHHPAFTASELMEILPYQINTKEKAGSGYGMTAKPRIEKNAVVYRCEYVSVNATYANVQSESLADALALLLIHLIENDLWKPSQP